MKKISVVILTIMIATTSIFAGNGHVGIGAGYSHDMTKDNVSTCKSRLDSAGIQLNSYAVMGNYVGVFSNTLINYGFKYNFETKSALGIKKEYLGVKDILAIDIHTMFGIAGRIPFNDSISLLLGLGGAAGLTLVESKKAAPAVDHYNIKLGLGLGFDTQIRIKDEESMGFSVGFAGNVYFKYYSFNKVDKKFEGKTNNIGYVLNPYIMIVF